MDEQYCGYTEIVKDYSTEFVTLVAGYKEFLDAGVPESGRAYNMPQRPASFFSFDIERKA